MTEELQEDRETGLCDECKVEDILSFHYGKMLCEHCYESCIEEEGLL